MFPVNPRIELGIRGFLIAVILLNVLSPDSALAGPPARQGHKVVAGGSEVGYVTSGTFSPTLEKALGMADVPVELAVPGGPIAIDVRGKELPARIVPLPFYKRPR